MAQPPRTDLLQHLEEQLSFIDASCAAFDSGHEVESKRLATHVRTLVHDTRRSTSLLTYLNVKAALWYFDTVVEKRQRIDSMRAMGGIPVHLGGLTTVDLSRGRYLPRALGDVLRRSQMSRFDDWWTLDALLPTSGPAPSRRDIVLWLANKDGGTHVDTLPPTYVSLTSGRAMGVTFGGVASLAGNSPIPAAMRQIAEELRAALRDQRELIEVASTVER